MLIDIDIYKDLHRKYMRERRENDELKRLIAQLRKELDRKNTVHPHFQNWDDIGNIFGGLFK
jgi:predicted nucleotidyltransferase